MRLPLCYPIESRDGTLNADSKMKNMVVENVEGEQVAVKRPGVTKQTELPPGLAQGLFSLNGVLYSMADDVLYKIGSGLSWNEAIPSTPSYHYAMEIDTSEWSGGNPTRDADWYELPIYPPYYPDYNFKDYPSVEAILAYINATYPDYGPWTFVKETRNYGTEYPNYPFIIGYISPANPAPWYPGPGGLGYVPVVIGHTK